MARRGEFGQSWWTQRWLAAMECLVDAGRLSRGRTYARRGSVLSIEVRAGEVQARVQGSRPSPYQVRLWLPTLEPEAWEKVLDVLASQALFAATLLTEEMPPTIEEAFAAAGVPLFPATDDDLQTDCSCPDWANPCKHVAAVHYLLGAEFDRDPFLLFELRGRSKDQVLADLRSRRSAAAGAAPVSETQSATATGQMPPLEDGIDRFWSAGEGLAQFQVRVTPPAVPAAILKQLGPPDLSSIVEATGWTARQQVETLEQIYAAVSQRALSLAYDEEPSSPTGKLVGPLSES